VKRKPRDLLRRGGLLDERGGVRTLIPKFVMPGLVPGIHVLAALDRKGVDGRDKPGHDGNLNRGS
jgi:hypothetical protein